MVYALSPARLGNAHDWPIPCGTRLPFMPDEQVLEHRVDALVFLVVQFRIFVKGHVFGSANSLHFAEHLDSFAFQGVEFCAHTFRPGGWSF
jgi:hypothetical protein